MTKLVIADTIEQMPLVTKANSQTKRRIFLLAYKKHRGNIAAACKDVQIERQTYYDWIGRHPEFANKIDGINEGIIDYVEQQLIKQVDNDNDKSIHFFLERKAKHRGYAKEPETNQTNNLLIGINPDQFTAIIERAHKAIGTNHNNQIEQTTIIEPGQQVETIMSDNV